MISLAGLPKPRPRLWMQFRLSGSMELRYMSTSSDETNEAAKKDHVLMNRNSGKKVHAPTLLERGPAQRVHVLGIGNLGKFLAHSIRKSHPDVPITLMFHRPSLLDQWKAASRGISLVTNDKTDIQQDFEVELLYDSNNSDQPITNLIVATKAYATKNAIKPLLHRINQSSTLMFLQNGMGTIEEVRKTLFASPYSRPQMVAGIISHGIYSSGPFSAIHAGFASTALAPIGLSRKTSDQSSASQHFLVSLVLSTSVLQTSLVPPRELLQAQLRKLTVNAVINPLTVVMDCINGDIFTHPDGVKYITELVGEISDVTRRILSAEGATQGIIDEFSEGNLLRVVKDIGQKTAKNISSMRQDVLAKRRTEIDYINGYIVRQASKFDLAVPCNQKMVDIVKSQEQKYLNNQVA